MLDLKILVGTQTGVAQLVAQEIELRLDGGDVRVRTLLMDDIEPSVFEFQPTTRAHAFEGGSRACVEGS